MRTDDASPTGRTPDRGDFQIGTSGLPRGEVGDRPDAGDFPWRVTNDYWRDVRPVR